MNFLLNGEFVSWQEYALALSVSGDPEKADDVARFGSLFDVPVEYRGLPVDAVVLDVSDSGPVVQLLLPEVRYFDSGVNAWERSEIRAFLNSDEFLRRFNREFGKLVKPVSVKTGGKSTADRFWLLSHEEVGYGGEPFLEACGETEFEPFVRNEGVRRLAAFDGTGGSRVFPGAFWSKIPASGWWLRSKARSFPRSLWRGRPGGTGAWPDIRSGDPDAADALDDFADLTGAVDFRTGGLHKVDTGNWMLGCLPACVLEGR